MLNLSNYEFLSLIFFPNSPETDQELATTLKLAILYIKELLDFDITIQGFLPFKLIIEKEIHCVLSKTANIIITQSTIEDSLLAPDDQLVFLITQFDMTILFFGIAQFDSVQNACTEKQIFNLMSIISTKLLTKLDKYLLPADCEGDE